MPQILWRILPHVVVVAAILGGLAFVYRSGASAMRQKLEFEREVQARITLQAVRRSEANMLARLAAIDGNLGAELRRIDAAEVTVIRPTIEREILRETRLSDPAAGLPAGLLEAINAARQLSCATAADGSVACALPAAEAGR